MQPDRIAELLTPFLNNSLSPGQLNNISIYIDLLIRWNSRINLTAIRQPEEIVTRHFGESLFAAQHLFPEHNSAGAPSLSRTLRQGGDVTTHDPLDLIDIGSGAGFPGLPIKIWAPEIFATLIESNQKKSTFLREIIRTLTLTNINVFSGRAQDFPGRARTVTLRAVERFDSILPTAIRLLAPGGRLALLVGEGQVKLAQEVSPLLKWSKPIAIPNSAHRVLLEGTHC